MKTLVLESIFNKVASPQAAKTFRKIWEIFKNNFFYRTPLGASEILEFIWKSKPFNA